ncbi:alpha-E domain-containing protein [Hyphobacterium sp. HN65]|uniref:Alpha-E domain-containing protein n=1 Tax=Hyphobacterium lacteum TaxID=3116575 RepID=A0ABU7LNQ6_9PROT|nr:alpha-E domain-containing protein [Hyphobacterium sp. HN65]MEE2525540.1 alpha-E domain-containing protein [Hyphobacterium sp. HN65]
MLGKTASGLYWMFRQLERSENTARLIDAGFRMALTRQASGQGEWASIVRTAGCDDSYRDAHDAYEADRVIDFLLRDPDNPSSVYSVFRQARNNARMVRTALTREVWESTNESWLLLNDKLAKPVRQADLPNLLDFIRQRSAMVRGAWHGTALRNDIYSFARLGTRIERADNTARILDVKYYVLLPSSASIGSSLDNVQWESILRSASAARAFNWLNGGETTPAKIAEFLMFNRQMPRSLIFCYSDNVRALDDLAAVYGEKQPSADLARATLSKLNDQDIDRVFEIGLHEFLTEFLRANNALASQIEADYRFVA